MLGLLLSLISQLMVAAGWPGAAGPGQAASLCPGQAGPAPARLTELVAIDQVTHKHTQPHISLNLSKTAQAKHDGME